MKRLLLLLPFIWGCGPAHHTPQSAAGEREPRIERAVVGNPGPVWGDSENGSFIGTPDGPVPLDDYVRENL